MLVLSTPCVYGIDIMCLCVVHVHLYVRMCCVSVGGEREGVESLWVYGTLTCSDVLSCTQVEMTVTYEQSLQGQLIGVCVSA